MTFKNKVALVTGASRGIGLAIAKTLTLRNANVIGTSRYKEGVSIINSHLGNLGKGLLLNINNYTSICEALKNINSEFGKIDILINNAGITRDNLLIKMKDDDWDDVLNTNLTSAFRLSKAVIPSMLKNRMGRIINISSIVGTLGNIGQSNYAAAKAGLIGLTKSLAFEIASRGITVNIVSPGFIETSMTKALNKDQHSSILSKIPMKRLGKSQEIANVVVFLASEEASYITGEIINVNGGMYVF
ncbi:3-oxoacyl-ACP reductase [Candidatus Pantoea edessiphila]|uniref:3-oxoacyl-[acyl-carrier-protein] reductase n=1 Tax=Candidatus Pantoea edessiphila TaxID=2044610 RepID=A0A2P5T2I6_9GAMM|nr:3-oxoacyl-ACP reductase FabG [Candidatus Pantoea edessiphila]PPI88773.1 3-oxoacyl-ACP reductase [Candidatus Pantoea edessiphila]